MTSLLRDVREQLLLVALFGDCLRIGKFGMATWSQVLTNPTNQKRRCKETIKVTLLLNNLLDYMIIREFGPRFLGSNSPSAFVLLFAELRLWNTISVQLYDFLILGTLLSYSFV